MRSMLIALATLTVAGTGAPAHAQANRFALGMKVGSGKTFGAGYNVRPMETLVTTPNSDVIYAMSYLDLGKGGPMVFEKVE